MNNNKVLIIIFLLLNLKSFAQINPCLTESEIRAYSEKANGKVLNYYSILTSIGDREIPTDKKRVIIDQTINRFFESDNTIVVNDIINPDEYPEYFKIKEYLNNISLSYKNYDVEFSIDSLTMSDIYYVENFYFIKVEVFREMTIYSSDQMDKNYETLDIFLKFGPNVSDCQIYNILKHKDNIADFEKVTICDSISPDLGTIIIKTDPDGATLKIAEKPLFDTITPYLFRDKPGIYNISLIKDGYYTYKSKITIVSNKSSELLLTLTPNTGSFNLNTVPDGALISIKEEPSFREYTPYIIENHKPGKLNVTFDKPPHYERYSTEIEILPNRLGNLNVTLIPVKRNYGQWLWLSGATITAAAGGYFKFSADHKFKEYQEATNSDDAADLKKQVQQYDKLTIASFSLAGICTVGFTISTVKKSKAKKNYAYIEMNGQGARLTYNF